MSRIDVFKRLIQREIDKTPQFAIAGAQSSGDFGTTTSIQYPNTDTLAPLTSVPSIFNDSNQYLNNGSSVITVTGDIPAILGPTSWVT